MNSTATVEAEEANVRYAVVANIPHSFRTSDLRAHFSSMVESNSFVCFHYRHRPEKDSDSSSSSSSDGNLAPKQQKSCCCIVKVHGSHLTRLLQYNNQHWTDEEGEYHPEMCEMSTVSVKTSKQDCSTGDIDEELLLKMPELRPPELMPQGNVGTPTLKFLDLIQRCLLPQSLVKKFKLKFPKTRSKRLYDNVNYQYDNDNQQKECGNQDKEVSSTGNSSSSASDPFQFKVPKTAMTIKMSKVKSSKEQATASEQGQADLSPSSVSIHSFEPPEETGSEPETSSSHLSNVGITSKQSSAPVDCAKHKQQSAHPANISLYNKGSHETKLEDGDAEKLSSREKKAQKKRDRYLTRKLMSEGIEERLIAIEKKYHNDEDAEEWDRHEASEDDPSNQERNKERLYEEEIEQPWEKGGPGVVFYTDAMFWQEREGDFDEQTTDDLDVDFSAYEEPGAGDMDIKDFLKIRQERRFRNGLDSTDRFSVGIAKRIKEKSASGSKPGSSSPRRQPKIGAFEQFSKGVGRKVMERQGWKEGEGLGSSTRGITEALRGDGQRPHNKRGLGYVEPGPVHFGHSAAKKKKERQHLITTIYDNPKDTDPQEPLLLRNEPTTLKHRQSHINSFDHEKKDCK